MIHFEPMAPLTLQAYKLAEYYLGQFASPRCEQYSHVCVMCVKDVQNEKRLGFKMICSQLDTTEAFKRLRI